MMLLQKVNDIRLFISVEALEALRRKATSNDSICDVSQVQVVGASLHPPLIS